MKVLELFCGTKSFSKVAESMGHECFTIDNNPKFNPDLCIDILNLTPDMIPFKPDIIWASPPCTSFSMMAIRHHWNKDGTPRTETCRIGIALAKKTLELIEYFKPKYWFIENPRAKLRKMDFMPNDNRKTITYCQYGMPYMKPTDIWTNLDLWFPKPMCSNGSPCHVRAPRGSRTGIQGTDFNKTNHLNFMYSSRLLAKDLRGIIPPLLCEEILKCCSL